MQAGVQARNQMVLIAIKMITREFKDSGVIWNGLGKYVERIASNHFPWCLFFVPVL
jgi:putative hemolysin